jgi:transitional endoplasmic reticulum ATPase
MKITATKKAKTVKPLPKKAKKPPAAPQLNQFRQYISKQLFENDALWHLTILSWRMANNASLPLADTLSHLWDIREFNNNLGLEFPRTCSSIGPRLKRINERMDAVMDSPTPVGTLTENLRTLCAFFELPETYDSILRYAVLLETSPGLGTLNNQLFEDYSFEQWLEVTADTLGVPLELLAEAYSRRSPLVQCGLIEINEYDRYSGNFVSVSKPFARLLRYTLCTAEQLLASCVDKAPEPELGRHDFSHIAQLWDSLIDGLTSAEPCHILLSGIPGTGKTQLALALGKACEKQIAMIKTESDFGECLEGHTRRIALLQGHHLMSKLKSPLLIIDEAENLLDNESGALELGRSRAPSAAKAWLNHFLEVAKLPTIWIVNNPEVLDPSILRRFTWVAPIPIPPRATRKRILASRFHGQNLSDDLLEELASRSDLPPYEAKRLAKVASLGSAAADTDSRVRHALSLADTLFQRKPSVVIKPVTAFDPSLLNINVSIDGLLAGLAANGQGRLGFFGPPGTGKTVLASEIARSLDKTLLLRTGSDILDQYIGQTEKNIALAFEEASDEEAVLLLDEVDSIASNRGNAHESWERSFTNELLIRLERFEGIAILATNFRDTLDPALARRLDRKIEFRELQTEQAWVLFCQHAIDATQDHNRQIGMLQLRLGDFAAALRGLRTCSATATGTALLEALKEEVTHRGNKNARRLGL